MSKTHDHSDAHTHTHDEHVHDHGEIPFTALLRYARRAYGQVVAQSLDDVGCHDLPRNGPYVLGALASTERPLEAIVRDLGVTTQAASQLVDTLVLRGYLERGADSNDRRRMTTQLSERGELAVQATRAAVQDLDARIAAELGDERVAAAREVLELLAHIAYGEA